MDRTSLIGKYVNLGYAFDQRGKIIGICECRHDCKAFKVLILGEVNVMTPDLFTIIDNTPLPLPG